MTIDERSRSWKQQAEYDFKTAEAMLKSKRYVYVGFMCQQALEKLLKAIYVSKKKEEPPYTHNLRRLADELALDCPSEMSRFFDTLMAYDIVGRYPSYKENVAKRLTKASSAKIFKETEKIFRWLQSQHMSKKR